MNNKEILTTYRALVIELEELQSQLRRVGNDGRPSGIRTAQLDTTRGTNDPGAAAMQLAEGLEEFIQRKQEEIQQLLPQVDELLRGIKDFRIYMVIHRYYVLARTDEQVARAMSLARTHVNRLRLEFLESR